MITLIILGYIAVWLGCAYIGFRYSVAGPSGRPGFPDDRTKWDDVRDGETVFSAADYTGMCLAVTFMWPVVAPAFALYVLAQVLFTAPLAAEDRRREARRENLARWRRQAAYGAPGEQQLARAVLEALGESR